MRDAELREQQTSADARVAAIKIALHLAVFGAALLFGVGAAPPMISMLLGPPILLFAAWVVLPFALVGLFLYGVIFTGVDRLLSRMPLNECPRLREVAGALIAGAAIALFLRLSLGAWAASITAGIA